MTVEHDLHHSRFLVQLPGGTAQLVYAESGEDAIDLEHTEVPPSDQGQGIADMLVTAAFAYAREQGLRIIPSCPYVRVWLRRHPGERELARSL